MPLTLVNNGDSGLVAREKINDAITAINNLVLSGSFTTSGTSGTSGDAGTSGINGINGTNGTSGTSGTSGTGGTGGTASSFSSYQNQPTATISGSADSTGACTAASSNIYFFNTYLTKGMGNIGTGPQVGDFAFTDATFTTPVPQFGTASFYGYKDGATDSHYKIVGMGGAVTETGVCSSPPPPPPPPGPSLTSFTIFTEGGAPMVISGSATSEAACGQVSTGFNMRTVYLQKTAPNIGTSVEVGDFVYEDAAGTNPIDSYNGNSFYGFSASPGAVAKTFNVTGFTGQVVTVNFC